MAELTTKERPAALAARYREVRAQTERLAAPLSPEDQTVQSMPDVSPTKWHRAHTSWFFETFLLEPGLPGYRVHDPEYGYLFNSYYESVGARYPRHCRGVVSRPGAASVGRYRLHVDEAMSAYLELPLPAERSWLVELGMHHEQQHQELLLMDIKHVLSCNPSQPAYVPPPPPGAGPSPVPPDASGLTGSVSRSAPSPQWLEHPGGLIEIGHRGDGFAFDNESPRHGVQLVPFALACAPVTCGEWAAFVADGGYRRPELWLSDGWATVQAQGWQSPLYWSRLDDEWWVFTLHGVKPVDMDEPVVHVSYYEADAFAHWAGARLPTEAEWEAVAAPAPGGRFLEAADTDPLLHPQSPPARGAAPSLLGEVWQWTSSAYSPYPGFRPAAGAVGEYNGKFMINQMVLRGGSCVTPAGHLRPSYRNFFPPSAQWAFSGVRLARDA
ncbi:MAG TPA: ergothioneine biosynthesis protein EgtB [Acidimicrobiales bacterium]|nr:ergothioneine biosynthesis protein EgtB [Acidimicrobiales bacterium]